MGTKTSISANLWEGAAFYVAVQAHNSIQSSLYSNIEYFMLSGSEYTVMTNPTDSQLLSVRGSDGTTVNYYGDRDESGIPTRIDRFSVVAADGTSTIITLDSVGRPKNMRTEEGVVFELAYEGDTLGSVTAVAPDGSLQVNTSFPIETDAGHLLPAEPMARALENGDTSECLIRLDRCGAGVTDADVTVTLTEPGAVSPSWQGIAEHTGNGIYSVYLPNSLRPSLNAEDLRKVAEDVATMLGDICTKLSLTPDAIGLLMAMCPQVGAKLATVTGPGAVAITTACVTVTGAVAAYCKVLGEGGAPGADSLAQRILKAIQDPNVLTGNITIHASAYTPGLPGLDSATATAPATGPFPTIDISVSDRSRISKLKISPAIPEALQSYDIITEIACLLGGEQLTIDVVRADDREVPVEYHFQFPPIWDETTTTLTRAIPAGGDFGAATDTATVTLKDQYGSIADKRTAIIEIPAAVPTITDISPKTGFVDTVVTITGTTFGQTEGRVLFNGTPTGIFASWTNTEIKTKVPLGATSGDVIVRDAEGRTSNGIYFEVKEVYTVSGTTDKWNYLSINYNFSGSNVIIYDVSVNDTISDDRYVRKITGKLPKEKQVCVSGQFIINAPKESITRYDLMPGDGTRLNKKVDVNNSVYVSVPFNYCLTSPASFTVLGQMYLKESLYSKSVYLIADFGPE